MVGYKRWKAEAVIIADIFHPFLIKPPSQDGFRVVSTPAGLDSWWTNARLCFVQDDAVTQAVNSRGLEGDSAMDHTAFMSWLTAYGRAWESRDSRAAADLFDVDGSYQVTPFLPPLSGRDAIFEYWVGVTQTASFVRKPPGLRTKLDGIFVVSLDAAGRCNSLREWWHKEQG